MSKMVVKKTQKGSSSDSVRIRREKSDNVKANNNRHLRSATSPGAHAKALSAPKAAVKSDKPTKVPKIPRIDKSLAVCRRELGRLYKQMRRGQVPLEAGMKYMRIIQATVDTILKESGDPAYYEAMVRLKEAQAMFNAAQQGVAQAGTGRGH